MSDVVIVGGGIVGCACAWELAKRGASATILEYGKAGMQATNAAAGILAPLSDESDAPDAGVRFGMRALERYPALVAELEAACGFGLEFMREGVLRVAFDDAGAEALQRRFGWQRELGLPVEWLDGAGCRDLEPRIAPNIIGGMFSQPEATISNQLLALALQRAAEALGARVVERAPVTGFTRRGGRTESVLAGGESYDCDTVVIAAGARSGQIAKRAGVALPVHPVRGQMIALGGMQAPVRRPVWGPQGYVVPRANGLIFAGSTIELVGFRRRTTKAGVRALQRVAATLVPQLGAAKLHFEWAGLRPGTDDGLPLIGPVPGTNVVAATGHYRSGILLGPITGAVVAAGIVDGDWAGVPEEMAASRVSAAVR